MAPPPAGFVPTAPYAEAQFARHKAPTDSEGFGARD